MSKNTQSRIANVINAVNAADGSYLALIHGEGITLETVPMWVQTLADAAMTSDDVDGRIVGRLVKCGVPTVDGQTFDNLADADTFDAAMDAYLSGEWDADDVRKAAAYVRKGYASRFRNGLQHNLGASSARKSGKASGALLSNVGRKSAETMDREAFMAAIMAEYDAATSGK